MPLGTSAILQEYFPALFPWAGTIVVVAVTLVILVIGIRFGSVDRPERFVLVVLALAAFVVVTIWNLALARNVMAVVLALLLFCLILQLWRIEAFDTGAWLLGLTVAAFLVTAVMSWRIEWPFSVQTWIGLGVVLLAPAVLGGGIVGPIAARAQRARKDREAEQFAQQRAIQQEKERTRRIAEAEQIAARDQQAEQAAERARQRQQEEDEKRDKAARMKAEQEEREAAKRRFRQQLEADEKAALHAAAAKDTDLTAADIRQRESQILDLVHRKTFGLSVSMQLKDISVELGLDPGQVWRSVRSMEARNLLRTGQAYERTTWTQKSVFLTEQGEMMMTEREQRAPVNVDGPIGVFVAGGKVGSVSVGAVGNHAKASGNTIGEQPSEVAFAALLEAMRRLRAEVTDPIAIAAVEHEIQELEAANDEPTRRSVAGRLVGWATSLGQIARPVLDAANGFKDLFS